MKSAIGKPKPKLLLADLLQLIAGSPATVIFAQGLVQKSLEPDIAAARQDEVAHQY